MGIFSKITIKCDKNYENYWIQFALKKIQEMQENVAGNLLMKSTGSMGQEKTETNPLVIQLPKYNDTANKTLSIMLDIIGKLGTAAPVGDKLGDFLNG